MTPTAPSSRPAFIFAAQIVGLTTILFIVLLADLRHGVQNAGGNSLRLPMDIFDEMRKEHNRIALVVHGVLWLLGMAGIFWSFRRCNNGIPLFCRRKNRPETLARN